MDKMASHNQILVALNTTIERRKNDDGFVDILELGIFNLYLHNLRFHDIATVNGEQHFHITDIVVGLDINTGPSSEVLEITTNMFAPIKDLSSYNPMDKGVDIAQAIYSILDQVLVFALDKKKCINLKYKSVYALSPSLHTVLHTLAGIDDHLDRNTSTTLLLHELKRALWKEGVLSTDFVDIIRQIGEPKNRSILFYEDVECVLLVFPHHPTVGLASLDGIFIRKTVDGYEANLTVAEQRSMLNRLKLMHTLSV